MKVFVTGADGKLGYDVIRELCSRNHEVLGSDILLECKLQAYGFLKKVPYISLDITDEKKVNKVIGDFNPDVVIHCAAWTAVDDAEKKENQKKVYDINVVGTKNIALACKSCNSKLVYISTDYVFNGEGDKPWASDCRSFKPLNYYGRTKLEGEQAVEETLENYFIIRTEWAFGIHGRNFVNIMLDIAKKKEQLSVVDDQIGSPTYFYDLSILLVDMIETEKYGYYNATNSGEYVSRYEFAKEIFRQAVALGHVEYGGESLSVNPIETKEYGFSGTIRPLNSRLDHSKLIEAGFNPLPSWQDALSRYMKENEF